MNNGPACNVSIRFGLQGPTMAIDSACSSGTHAVGMAFHLIRSGMISTAVTGGADSPFSPGVVQSWSDLRLLSPRNEPPSEACRPFSKDRDGIVLGEGAGVLTLESEEAVRRRKARVYAEVTGYGATNDGVHLTQPSRAGIGGAMRRALSDAGLRPEQIDHVNAHATGTPWNDRTETEALKEVFGDCVRRVPVVGIKAATGHAIAASGALELISCALSIRDQAVPPTLNVKTPDPECDLDYVTEGRRSVPIAHAMSNSFAFGGSNAVLILSRCDIDTL
jgi:3-oxoacyl-(acyl-carrier-protein) synthase